MQNTAKIGVLFTWLLAFVVYQRVMINKRQHEESYDFHSLPDSDVATNLHSEIYSELKHLLNDFEHWENVCVFQVGRTEWMIEVRDHDNRKRVMAKGKQKPIYTNNERKIIYFKVYQGENFDTHSLNVTFPHEELTLEQTQNIRRIPGTYLLTSHHTPNNQFHLHNDFLLPVYRIHRMANINGVLLFQGCTACWENRLNITNHIIEGAMQLNILYSLEQATTNSHGICVDRLIISRTYEFPYYNHKGRFSSLWPPDLFSDYRNLVHEHFRSQASNYGSREIEPIAKNNTKPILTWISRGTGDSCIKRCIKNEREVYHQLSRLFQVRMLRFDKHVPEGPRMISIMESDILMGLHGAGLAYTSLLKKGAIIVEIKSMYGKEKTLFLNMAASLNISYFAVNLEKIGLDVGGQDVHRLPKECLRKLANDIYAAYQRERDFCLEENIHVLRGECNFPTTVWPYGTLSSYNYSRCYLREYSNIGEWRQCVSFDFC
jgi:hypothetical protein